MAHLKYCSGVEIHHTVNGAPLKSRAILNGPSQKLYKAVLLIADSVRTIASKHVRLCWK